MFASTNDNQNVLLNDDLTRINSKSRHNNRNVLLPLQWRHNRRYGVSNHQPHDCFLNRLIRRRSKKISKLRVTDLCARNSPETSEFPAQMAINAENVSISWRHHDVIRSTRHPKGIGSRRSGTTADSKREVWWCQISYIEILTSSECLKFKLLCSNHLKPLWATVHFPLICLIQHLINTRHLEPWDLSYISLCHV